MPRNFKGGFYILLVASNVFCVLFNFSNSVEGNFSHLTPLESGPIPPEKSFFLFFATILANPSLIIEVLEVGFFGPPLEVFLLQFFSSTFFLPEKSFEDKLFYGSKTINSCSEDT